MANNITFYKHNMINPFGPRTTFAAKLINGEYKVGVAFCSDEEQYCRKTGRELAESRMNDGLIVTLSDLTDELSTNMFTEKAAKRIKDSITIEDFSINAIFIYTLNFIVNMNVYKNPFVKGQTKQKLNKKGLKS